MEIRANWKSYEFNGEKIYQNLSDGYISLTDIDQATGHQQVENWLWNNEALFEVIERNLGLPEIPLITSYGDQEENGFYAHPLIALNYAYHCNRNLGFILSTGYADKLH